MIGGLTSPDSWDIWSLPVAELLAGIGAMTAAVVLSSAQPSGVRRPWLLGATTTLGVAFGLGLAPARLVLVCLAALLISVSGSVVARGVIGVLVIGVFLGTMPTSMTGRQQVVVAAVMIASALASVLAARRGGSHGLAVVLFATMLSAVLATPDTERVGLTLGAIGALILADLIWSYRPSGIGAVVLTTTVIWAVAIDSRGRPASFVVVVILAALIAVVAVFPRLRWWWVALISCGLATVIGRGVGLEPTSAGALLEALFWLCLAGVLLAVGPRTRRVHSQVDSSS